MIDQQRKNHLLIVAIFAMTIVPFMLAWSLRGNTTLINKGTNHGQLIVPPKHLDYHEWHGFDAFSQQNKGELQGHWLIVNIIPKAECAKTCLEAILKTKQLRLMLSKDLPRVRRLVLVLAPLATDYAGQLWLKDSVLWRLKTPDAKDGELLYDRYLQDTAKLDDQMVARLTANEKPELALHSDLLRFQPDNSAVTQIKSVRTDGNLPDGMVFLIDPLGNLMMQYEPGFDPYKVKDDLMHLLRISQIG